jgi:hypothetical protein
VDDRQLIADEEEEQSDDIGQGEVAGGKKRMKLFAIRLATAGPKAGRERNRKRKKEKERKRGNTASRANHDVRKTTQPTAKTK